MKNGFTIVELLAVIIIISLLVTLTGLSTSKLVKNSKKTLTDIQKSEIINAAKIYMSDNIGINIESGECKYITLSKLIEKGYIENIQDLDEAYIKITLDESKILTDYIYVIDNSIESCDELS